MITLKKTEIVLPQQSIKENKSELSNEELAYLEETKIFQQSLEIGNPDEAFRKIAGTKKAKKAPLENQIKAISTQFKAVSIPKEIKRISEQAMGKDLPKIVMVQVDSTTESVHFNKTNPKSMWGVTEYSAPVPLIPKYILEKAAEAKRLAPSGSFHLVWVPSWKKEPQKDPILLRKVGKNYFEIGSWGGDKDLLKEFVLEA